MDFDQERRRKWMAGRRERGLDVHGPFIGNPAEEMQHETLDLANYADQLLGDGDLSEQEADRYISLAREMYLHMGAVRARRAERLMTESRAFHAEETDDCYARA